MVRDSACHSACMRSISNLLMKGPFIGGALPSAARRAPPMKENNAMNQIEIEPKLPRHYLLAWQAVKDLAIAVKEAGITDAQLREQAMKAAKSACLNCCEGA